MEMDWCCQFGQLRLDNELVRLLFGKRHERAFMQLEIQNNNNNEVVAVRYSFMFLLIIFHSFKLNSIYRSETGILTTTVTNTESSMTTLSDGLARLML